MERRAHEKYQLLVILTDGILDDLEATSDAIVRCSRLGVSIIVIGIGSSNDWTKMDALDSDDRPLVSLVTGESAMRDCVHFVAFDEFKHDIKKLSDAVLEEVPRQYLEYAALHRLKPSALL